MIELNDLNLEYGFEKETDNDFLNTLMEVRQGLVKEIVEYFGEDCGTVKYNREYKTAFDVSNIEGVTNHDLGLPEESKDDIVKGLLRFANATGIDGSGGRWARAVNDIAAWYVANIHEYNQSKLVYCDLVNKDVRCDCSGFIGTCLWRYGALQDMSWPPGASAYINDTSLEEKLNECGFEKLSFSWETVHPYDIIARNNHVEIYNGIFNGKHTSWSWGSVHDDTHGGLPCGTAHVSSGYDVIYRNKQETLHQMNSTFGAYSFPMLTSGQMRANALKIMSVLQAQLGLTKQQAAGIAGVLIAESGCNPQSFGRQEKAGTYHSSGANNEGTPYGTKHCPWSYGAGICAWTFTQTKEKVLMGGLGISRENAVAIIKGAGIESLSLDQQIQMLVYYLKVMQKNTLIGVTKCDTASLAAATFYCHAVAGYSSSTQPATQTEIAEKNRAYAKAGAQSQINKGMSFAEGLMR